MWIALHAAPSPYDEGQRKGEHDHESSPTYLLDCRCADEFGSLCALDRSKGCQGDRTTHLQSMVGSLLYVCIDSKSVMLDVLPSRQRKEENPKSCVHRVPLPHESWFWPLACTILRIGLLSRNTCRRHERRMRKASLLLIRWFLLFACRASSCCGGVLAEMNPMVHQNRR